MSIDPVSVRRDSVIPVSYKMIISNWCAPGTLDIRLRYNTKTKRRSYGDRFFIKKALLEINGKQSKLVIICSRLVSANR